MRSAALVEEAAAAAEAQQDQAQRLSQLVGVFKLAPLQPAASATGRANVPARHAAPRLRDNNEHIARIGAA